MSFWMELSFVPCAQTKSKSDFVGYKVHCEYSSQPQINSIFSEQKAHHHSRDIWTTLWWWVCALVMQNDFPRCIWFTLTFVTTENEMDKSQSFYHRWSLFVYLSLIGSKLFSGVLICQSSTFDSQWRWPKYCENHWWRLLCQMQETSQEVWHWSTTSEK